MKKAAICIVFLHLLLTIFTASVLAFQDETHGLSLVMPSEYVELTKTNAGEQEDLLDSLGYTEESFLTFLKKSGILVFAMADNNKKQIMVKSWQSDFSNDVEDLAQLDDNAVSAVAAQLITDEKLNYKFVAANSMKLIEIRTSSKDSGGDFSSVQYLTIRNGRFYSLIFSFSEPVLSEQSVSSAWGVLAGYRIESKLKTGSFWDFSSILIMILVCILVLAALIVIGLIIFSFISDFRNRKKQVEDGSDISIKRRKF